MNVLIRADASLTIGSGHIMRCLCLADALRLAGASVHFVSRNLPPHLGERIVRHGHMLTALPMEKADELTDVNQTVSHGGAFDMAVVDHYGLGRAWEARMRNHAKLLVIDDVAREHDCDWLLDQNFHPQAEERYAGRLTRGCALLLGPRFAMLRPEFLEARLHMKPREDTVQRLLVFLGGMDADNATGKVLAAIERANCDNLAIDVVIGASQPARSAIEAWCAARPDSRCVIQAENMAELLSNADLAIGAGGTATWERCALGLPTLALCLADNQLELLRQGSRHGFLYAPEGIAENIDAIALHLRALLENEGLRNHISRTGFELVDGAGVQRVVAAIMQTSICLRRASQEDSQSLYAWRNHPRVRAMSRNTDEIIYEQHVKWLNAVLADPQRHLLIGERDDGRAVGVLRFDVEQDMAEVSIYLAPDRIGHGEGAALLSAGETWLRAEQPMIRQLNACINVDNSASLRLFERCGYSPQTTQYIKRI